MSSCDDFAHTPVGINVQPVAGFCVIKPIVATEGLRLHKMTTLRLSMVPKG